MPELFLLITTLCLGVQPIFTQVGWIGTVNLSAFSLQPVAKCLLVALKHDHILLCRLPDCSGVAAKEYSFCLDPGDTASCGRPCRAAPAAAGAR